MCVSFFSFLIFFFKTIILFFISLLKSVHFYYMGTLHVLPKATSPLLLLSASVDTTSSQGVNNKSPCNDVETIKRVLDEIDNIALKRTNEGLNEINFSVGVCNCLFIVYVWGISTTLVVNLSM